MDLQKFADSSEEKRFPATPKRRRKAREKGQVARSGDLSAAVLLLGLAAVLQWWVPAMAQRLGGFAVNVWSAVPSAAWDAGSARTLMGQALFTAVGALLPVLGAAAIIALAVGVAQVGVGFSPAALMPQFQRVNPVSGLQRLFSVRSAVEAAKTLLKLVLIGVLTYASVRQALGQMPVWLQAGVGATVVSVAQTAASLVWRLGAVFALLAAGDYAYQRATHEKQLRMTRQEVKEEVRESEGDPQLRARIRRRQREMARRRMLSDVRQADVVVVNPTHYAVALRYRPEAEAAPVVVAKGKGWLAQRIRTLAIAHGVTIMEEPPLARALYAGVKVGQAIPLELYQAVAQVLAYVWQLKGKVS